MEESLSNEYWKKRCELAEKVLGNTPLYSETQEDWDSYKEWFDFTQSPTDTALYTGFIDLLKANDMWYELFESELAINPHELRFGKNGTNFQLTGTIVTSYSIYELFETGVRLLKSH